MNITRKYSNKGFTLVELLVVIAIIAALAAMATPVIMKQQKKAAMVEATSNAKQIFYLLVDFDQEYGTFPGSKITTDDIPGASSTTTNDVMRQLFLAGYTKSEEVFFAKTTFTKKPDGDIGTPDNSYAEALAPGECGFLYIDEQSTGVNSARPILAAPLLADNGSPSAISFDADMYGGRMVALRVDGAVKQYRVDETDFKAKTKVASTQVDIFTTTSPPWKTATSIKPIYPSTSTN